MFAPIARCFGHSLADPGCDDGQEWPRPPLNQFAVSHQNAFYVKTLADWRKIFQGDSFDFDYHLMWANWRQLTDTGIARIYHEDLQHLKLIGLNGLISCQSFRAFYPSGLAMTVLAESLWNPDVPWAEKRQRYLDAAFGEDAAFADDYLARVEEFLDTGDAHRRMPPLSNADARKLEAFAAFLDSALAELAARKESASDRVRGRSLALLSHHARLLQFIVQAYQAQLAGKPKAANRALDRAVDFLRRTEPRYSIYLDASLALRFSVEAHRS